MVRQRALLILMLGCWSCLPAPGLTGQQSTVEQAWSLAANGDRNGAISLLKEIVKSKHSNAEAHLLLGSLQSEAGQRGEAISELTEAVHLLPKSSEAFNALGEAYNRFGEYKAAQLNFERAIVFSPNFGVAHENLGAVLLQLGEAKSAGGHLDRSLVLLGKSAAEAADAHYLRAKIYSGENNFNKAAEHLQKAVAIRPDFAEAWSDLGIASKATGDDAAALVAFQRAVELDANGAIAQYRLGAEYLRRDEPQLAIGALEAAYKLNPQDQSTLNSLQSALRQMGRSEEAAIIKQKLAEMLHERDVKSQNAVKALQVNNEGSALEKAGHLPEALLQYREAVSLNPEHVGMRTNLAIALLRLGQWTEGINELHASLEREPGNEPLRVTLQDAISKAPPNLLPDWARLPKK